MLSPQNCIICNVCSLPVISPFLTLKLHQVSLPSRTPLTAPNLTLPLASLVHSSAHHLAVTSNAVPEETCNLQVPNLEGKKPEAITCCSLFHCLNYIFFFFPVTCNDLPQRCGLSQQTATHHAAACSPHSRTGERIRRVTVRQFGGSDKDNLTSEKK